MTNSVCLIILITVPMGSMVLSLVLIRNEWRHKLYDYRNFYYTLTGRSVALLNFMLCVYSLIRLKDYTEFYQGSIKLHRSSRQGAHCVFKAEKNILGAQLEDKIISADQLSFLCQICTQI